MSLTLFLKQLQETGRVRVPPLVAGNPTSTTSPEERLAVHDVLEEFERRWRPELVDHAPDFYRPAARWAAERFYEACQLLVTREAGADEVQARLAGAYPERSHEIVYSVDLVFRFLPDLHRLATLRCPGDPLVTVLEEWAVAWPLSSVGCRLAERQRFDLRSFWDHPSLRTLYVDRVIANADRTRLEDPTVETEIQGLVGAHPELALSLADALGSGEA